MSLRRRPRVVGGVAAGLAVVAAAFVARGGDPPPRHTSLSLPVACRLVLAYRDAELGPATLAAREELRSVVHRLPKDGTPAQTAVRTYADATLGPPTAGPARYLQAADHACRKAGVALYVR